MSPRCTLREQLVGSEVRLLPPLGRDDLWIKRLDAARGHSTDLRWFVQTCRKRPRYAQACCSLKMSGATPRRCKALSSLARRPALWVCRDTRLLWVSATSVTSRRTRRSRSPTTRSRCSRRLPRPSLPGGEAAQAAVAESLPHPLRGGSKPCEACNKDVCFGTEVEGFGSADRSSQSAQQLHSQIPFKPLQFGAAELDQPFNQ